MLFKNPIISMYKKQMFSRCDDSGNAFYFTHHDFEGLAQENYAFKSSKGHKLQGYFYHYNNYQKNRIIIFDHGFGEGHRAYMKEIECLCQHGYLVFAYDHTGCMASGGQDTGGLSQSLVDLNDCLCALKNEETLKDYSFSVIGHSWGGYSCLNISALHPDITHVVVISGFISVMEMIRQNFIGILKSFRKKIYELEKTSNPEFVLYDGIETLKATSSKVLLIYSDDDPLVQKTFHYDPLHQSLSQKNNIHFLLTHHKKHNPNYTADAVNYLTEYQEALSEKKNNKALETPQQKAEFIQSYDWQRMTQQDQEVWDTIFKHLDNK